jgi:hypothetical protein
MRTGAYPYIIRGWGDSGKGAEFGGSILARSAAVPAANAGEMSPIVNRTAKRFHNKAQGRGSAPWGN